MMRLNDNSYFLALAFSFWIVAIGVRICMISRRKP
jgi:hypothetical protein